MEMMAKTLRLLVGVASYREMEESEIITFYNLVTRNIIILLDSDLVLIFLTQHNNICLTCSNILPSEQRSKLGQVVPGLIIMNIVTSNKIVTGIKKCSH